MRMHEDHIACSQPPNAILLAEQDGRQAEAGKLAFCAKAMKPSNFLFVDDSSAGGCR